MPHVSISGLQQMGALGQGISLYGWHGHNGFVGPRRGYNFRIYPMMGWNAGLMGGGLGETAMATKFRLECEAKTGNWSWDSLRNLCVDRDEVERQLAARRAGRDPSQPPPSPTAPISTTRKEAERARSAGVPFIQTPLSAGARRFFKSRGLSVDCRIMADRWFGSSAPPNQCRICEGSKCTDFKHGAYALNLNPSVAANSLLRQGVTQRQLVPTPGGVTRTKPRATFRPDIVRTRAFPEGIASNLLGPDGKPLPGAKSVTGRSAGSPPSVVSVTSAPSTPRPTTAIDTTPPGSTSFGPLAPQQVTTQGYFPTDNAGRPLDSGFAPVQGGPAIFGGEAFDVGGFGVPLWALIAGAGVAIYALKK